VTIQSGNQTLQQNSEETVADRIARLKSQRLAQQQNLEESASDRIARLKSQSLALKVSQTSSNSNRHEPTMNTSLQDPLMMNTLPDTNENTKVQHLLTINTNDQYPSLSNSNNIPLAYPIPYTINPNDLPTDNDEDLAIGTYPTTDTNYSTTSYSNTINTNVQDPTVNDNLFQENSVKYSINDLLPPLSDDECEEEKTKKKLTKHVADKEVVSLVPSHLQITRSQNQYSMVDNWMDNPENE